MLVVSKRAIEGIKQHRITSLKEIDEAHSKQMGDADYGSREQWRPVCHRAVFGRRVQDRQSAGHIDPYHEPAGHRVERPGAQRLAKYYWPPIQQALHKYCIPRLSRGTELLISELGFDAELIGASVLVMENFDKEVKSQLVAG